MRKFKIIQLACYQGNIGDNANIVGTRALLDKNLDFDIEYTDLEILDFLWGLRRYDDHFVELINQHDLLIIGGGGYFELTVDHTCTGTPLDLSVDVLRQIDTPIVFYALGMDTARGVPNERLNKFKKFLDYLITSDKILVSIRNDGSMDAVRKLLGDEYASRMYKVPDGGFFTVVQNFHHPELPHGKRIIGINLAGDMSDFRFPGTKRTKWQKLRRVLDSHFRYNDAQPRKISIERFLKDFGALMKRYLAENEDLDLVLIPHIYKDLNPISRFILKLGSPFGRRRVTIAPYLQGKGAQEYIFDLYRKCDLVMGMRFHTNVCGIGLNVPTIGFITYPQIENLYRELGLSDRALVVNEEGFEKKLTSLLDESFSNRENIKKRQAEIRAKLLDQINAFHEVMQDWLTSLMRMEEN